MTYRILAFAIFTFIVYSNIFSQNGKKVLNSYRTTSSTTIDGFFNETSWSNAETGSKFIQFEPVNGSQSKYSSEVKIMYNDYAIYIGAILHDIRPDSIMKQLSARDQIGQSDFFGITIAPFNDGLTGYTFIVTPANVQFDARQSDWEDTSWDAVWVSSTKITNTGWQVEIEIPYSELRFPKQKIQEWGINMVRNVQRTREKSFWNHVNNSIDGYLKQSGTLKGIKDIEPPIRLSFTPYLSGYLLNKSETPGIDYELRGGLDLKYGLNESYTLDMMLVPDFGQVESDDKVLNITAFETYYDEKRPFFTEGTELFDKGEIFYSRRIGSIKSDYSDSDFNLIENEEVISTPSETSLINATKISGKSTNGLSIGFLNAISTVAESTIKDTISEIKRKALLQPHTNYNVLVLDQSLKNNSYISLANTNYLQPKYNYQSNVAATDMRFETKNGNYAFEAIGGFSYINDTNSNDSSGYKYMIEFEKITGNFRFGIEQSLATKQYNQNDMGFLPKTDELETEIGFGYNIYKPFWRLLKSYNWVEYSHFTLFSQNKYAGSMISTNSFATFRNYLSVSIGMEFKPKQNDYYEARVEGRVLKIPGYAGFSTYISPDYRKKYVLDVEAGIYRSFEEDMHYIHGSLMPIIRFSDKFNLNMRVKVENEGNLLGFIEHNDSQDSIYIGRRNSNTLTNSVNINYNFNADMAISLKARHYWRAIQYQQFYLLNTNGTLNNNIGAYNSSNVNSNYFNIDLVYRWRFAPGSELSLVWKNSIDDSADEAITNYFTNVNNLLHFEKQNSISLRVLYYINYFKTSQKINKRKKANSI